MKKVSCLFLMVIAAIILVLGIQQEKCRNFVDETIGQNKTIELISDSDKKDLLLQSKILYEHIMNSLFNLKNVVENDYDTITDREIFRFLIYTLHYLDNSEYRYANTLILDSEGYIHASNQNINRILGEVFDKDKWSYDTEEWEYIVEQEEYVLFSGFGIGNNFECKNIQTDWDVEKSQITVLGDIYASSQFPNYRLLFHVEMTFDIMQDNEGPYLRYKLTQNRKGLQ